MERKRNRKLEVANEKARKVKEKVKAKEQVVSFVDPIHIGAESVLKSK